MKDKINTEKPTISAIVLARNEEPVIEDCLKSIKWTNEIIVVDHCSVDKTQEIAQKYGAKIVESKEKSSFSERRNLGAKEAGSQWLLYVDADERVTPELEREIQDIISRKDNIFAAYTIPRKNIRLTKILYHGGWWPDRVLRLIKKENLISWEGELHEQPKINGKVGELKEAFLHFSHRGSFEHKLQNTINWSEIEARKMFEANHPPVNIVRFLTAMWREFYKRMIKYQAWRDGLEGVIEVIYQVFSVFISYARLWEMQQNYKIKKKNNQ